MTRATWHSRVGFIFAAAGSAVGLANIWRFPFVVGNHGGAAFVLVYLFCLALIGIPVFLAEVMIGRKTELNPSGAFEAIGKSKGWGLIGKGTIVTGFIVSAFYSAVAGWILGYLVEAVFGGVSSISNPIEAVSLNQELLSNPFWSLGYHALFLGACVFVLLSGVQSGIERANRFLMPLLYIVLAILLFRGLTLPNADQGVWFLFQVDWNEITPAMFLIALGQSFFTLSLGQGTMVTYGSYLKKNESILASGLPVVLMDTLVSLFTAVVIFSIVFSVGLEPDAGESLIFQTLPIVFSQIPGGYFIAILFFLLIVLAAITSEISAIEPTVAYLMDRFSWTRRQAVWAASIGVFIVGVPCALSTNLLSEWTVFGFSILGLLIFAASSILIPLGGFFAVILVGWKWGLGPALAELRKGAETTFDRWPILDRYFRVCFRYLAPVLILIVLLNALGILTTAGE